MYVTPSPSSIYLHTSSTLASWQQAYTVSRKVQTSNNFYWLVIYFMQWVMLVSTWNTWVIEYLTYAGNLPLPTQRSCTYPNLPHPTVPYHPLPQAIIQGYTHLYHHPLFLFLLQPREYYNVRYDTSYSSFNICNVTFLVSPHHFHAFNSLTIIFFCAAFVFLAFTYQNNSV